MSRVLAITGGSVACWVVLAIMASNASADDVEMTENLTTTDVPTTEIPAVQDKGWYTVIGNKLLRHNREYDCAVTVYPKDTSTPTTVTVEIVGKLKFNDTFKISQTSAVEPSTTKIFKLLVGELSDGDYTLTALGEGGLEFSNSSKLDLQSKSTSLLIQTDKAVYKPGAKVQFRVLALDSNLKPNIKDDIHVYIEDGDGNRVKEWRRVNTKKGVWSGEMQLSDNPVLGNWKIQVSATNEKATKIFEVAEYVLPKFEVSLNVPSDVGPKEATNVAVHVSARYTYGGPVKGEATITAKQQWHSNKGGVSKTVAIDGDAVVEFDLIKEFGLDRFYHVTIELNAEVEEKLTGKKLNGTGSISIHESDITLNLVNPKNYFHPGLKKTMYLKVAKHDGTPITDKDMSIKIKARYSYDTDSEATYEIHPTGMNKLTFDPPTNASNLEVKALVGNRTHWLSNLNPFSSPSNTYISAFVTTLNPKVNSDIEVEVNMTEHNPSVVYQVIGKGGVLLAGSVPIKEGETATTFKFPAVQEMAPKARLIVYYLKEDKEVVADSVDINIDYAFPNFVKVESNVTESEPGRGIKLKLKAEPNSYVGLLGVDQSVLLLKKGNDISKEDVLKEIEAYDKEKGSGFGFGFGGHWSPSTTVNSIFENAKAFVLTNGLVHVYNFRDHYPTYMLHSAPMNRPGVLFGGAVAFSSPPSGASLDSASFSAASGPRFRPKPVLRSNFPETWIWQGVDTDDNGLASMNETVPDSITSWVISAFSIDSSHGLGLIEQPAKIKVFRPFFISLDLPYSVIRGETVTIPVLVFNYMDTEVTADVTLVNPSGQFEFGDTTNSLSDKPEEAKFRKERLTVKPNSGERTSFTITATELGFIGIKVTARSDIAADAVERKLLVKAEGETQYKNQAVFVDLRKADSLDESVAIDIPDNHVDGSSRIEVSAVGDILGTSLSNLERLIRMPFGCGEQNMLNFVPNIVVLDYLKNSNKLTPAIESKCLKYMETGYQRELTYKHKDGSFSAFGDSDRFGSTWLTAFVLKSFASAEPHMNIENQVIEHGLSWLAARQTPNGSFPEVGTVSHKDMQGGAGQGLALTSYSLLPFLAYNKPEYSSTVEKALDYVVKQLDSIRNDSYSLAISTYVLHLAQHPAKDAAFEQLESNAHTTRSMKRWKRAEKKSDKENPHARTPNSVDVEMTAYAMLTYLERGLVEESMPIMSWLMSQQNSDGGFASTQDTVVALTALSKLAAKVADKNPDITVTFSTDKGFSKDININSDNSLILQKLEIPGKADKVNVKAKGHGLGIVQVSYSYNMDVTGAWPMFNLSTKVNSDPSTDQLLLDICSSFMKGVDGDDDESNMVVMEVALPSGYAIDQDSLPELKTSHNVKRVELKEADTHVVLYFDKMTKEELCPRITAIKTHKIEKGKPVPVTVYDYYDQSRRARVFYSPPDSCQQQQTCSTEIPA